MVDARGGLELLRIAPEVVEVVSVLHLLLFGKMVGIETGLRFRGREAATAHWCSAKISVSREIGKSAY